MNHTSVISSAASTPPSYPFDPASMRQARIQSGYSIEEASCLAHLNKMTLLRYESGDIRRISEARLLILADLYHVPAAYLLGIPADREFILSEGKLHFIPDAASEISHLGKRLLCVSQSMASAHTLK